MYHTSAAGAGILFPVRHPCCCIKGFSGLAHEVVPATPIVAPVPFGQLLGAGRAPRLVALPHASFTGGVPPGGQPVTEHGGGAVFIQLNVAAQPGAVMLLLEINTNVKHPFEEVKIPGLEVPVKTPRSGANVLEPL